MTLFFDASAIVGAHVDGPARAVVAEAIAALPAASEAWCASGLALPESLALVDRLTDEAVLRADLEDAIRLMWDRMYVVPVDGVCLDEAAVLARAHPIRMSDAIHLAAASRLPRPVRLLTFDPGQIPVALGLGFEVVST